MLGHIRGRVTPKWRICARPLMGWAKIAPALRAFRPQKVHRTFCRAVPEPVLTVENARKGAKPFLALFAPGICSAVATRSAGKCGTWKERMLLSENRCPLFRSMRVSGPILDPTQLIVKSSPRPRVFRCFFASVQQAFAVFFSLPVQDPLATCPRDRPSRSNSPSSHSPR